MDFIAFDLETTGIHPETDRIVEIGAVRFRNDEPAEIFETLIHPGIPIPPQASAVNGITDEMVAEAPDLAVKLEEFADFCGARPLVAHNAPFDFKFVETAVNLGRLKAPRGVVLDSCELARRIVPGVLNYKLSTLIAHLHLPTGNFHRAVDDARCCGLLFCRLLEIRHAAGEPVSVADLVALGGKAERLFSQPADQPSQLDLF
jgi:DNA polymerase-3 subunit epsilon